MYKEFVLIKLQMEAPTIGIDIGVQQVHNANMYVVQSEA